MVDASNCAFVNYRVQTHQRMFVSRLAGYVPVVALLLALCIPLRADFDVATLSRLIIMDDREIAPIRAAEVAWLDDAIVVGGWEHWPDRPVILASGPSVAMPLFPGAVHPPYFTVQQSPASIISWTRDEFTQKFTVAALRLDDGRLTVLDPTLACLAPGPLLAADNSAVIAACRIEAGVVEIRRLLAGSVGVVLARLPRDACDALVMDDDDVHVRALCPGDPPICYRINTISGLWAEAEITPRQPQQLTPSVQFDRASLRVIRPISGERVVLAEAVHAACASPNGRAILTAGPDGLFVLDPAAQVHRRLWGAQMPKGRPSLVSWAPDGVRIAHCYEDGDGGWVRLATLGTEEVIVRVTLPEGTDVRPGSRIWVAERFHVDAAGLVVEPVWATLKALLRVREVVRTANGLVCSAVSEGQEGGVVERLTGSNDPPPGSEPDSRISIGTGAGAPAPWVYTFTTQPREELAGWVEGERVTGRVLSVTVTRRRLAPLQG